LCRISLELPDACTQTNHVALATAKADVSVRLDGRKKKKNIEKKEKKTAAKAVDMGDLGDVSNIALSDDQNYYSDAKGSFKGGGAAAAAAARQHYGTGVSNGFEPSR
jgi:hypothetical protein